MSDYGKCGNAGPVGMICQLRAGHTGQHEFKKNDGQINAYKWVNKIGQDISPRYDRNKLAKAFRVKHVPPGARMAFDRSLDTVKLYTGQGDRIGYQTITMQALKLCEREGFSREEVVDRTRTEGKSLVEIFEKEPLPLVEGKLAEKIANDYGVAAIFPTVNEAKGSRGWVFTFHGSDHSVFISEDEIVHETDFETAIARILDKKAGRVNIQRRFHTDDEEFAARRRRKRG